MTLTLLTGATLQDVQGEISRLLGIGMRSSCVRRLAEEAEGSVVGIFDFVRGTFPYAPDPHGMELFISPHRMAEDYYRGRIRSGDCDDLAMIATSMMLSVGENSRVALVNTQGLGIDHAIAQVLTPELGWLNVDPASRLPLGWVLRGERVYVYPGEVSAP